MPEQDRLSPSDFDRPTAPEYARMYAIELSHSDDVVEKAVQLADDYGLNGTTSRDPQSIASGAVYLAGLLHNEKRTQAEVADVAPVTTITIAKSYREIADGEGLIPEQRREVEESEQEQNTILDRIIDRVRPGSGGESP